MLSDKTPDQVKNAAHLPGIIEASIAMPDAHWGHGLPVGGVVAADPHEGVIHCGPRGLGHQVCTDHVRDAPLLRLELPRRGTPDVPHAGGARSRSRARSRSSS